jgi:hypothetical protein
MAGSRNVIIQPRDKHLLRTIARCTARSKAGEKIEFRSRLKNRFESSSSPALLCSRKRLNARTKDTQNENSNQSSVSSAHNQIVSQLPR